MVSKGLKPGDIFTDHGRKYKVLSVNSDGTYVSSYIGKEEKLTNNEEASEQNEKSEEVADQNEESLEKKYTKTQIRRMKKEELDLLCTEYGIDVEETDAKREALIEKLGV